MPRTCRRWWALYRSRLKGNVHCHQRRDNRGTNRILLRVRKRRERAIMLIMLRKKNRKKRLKRNKSIQKEKQRDQKQKKKRKATSKTKKIRKESKARSRRKDRLDHQRHCHQNRTESLQSQITKSLNLAGNENGQDRHHLRVALQIRRILQMTSPERKMVRPRKKLVEGRALIKILFQRY